MFFSILAEIVTWSGLVGTIIAVVLAIRATIILTPVSLEKAHVDWLRSFNDVSEAEETVNPPKNDVVEVGMPLKKQRLPFNQTLQRAFDITFALLVLGCFWPVFAMFALLIRLDSPGPVLIAQQRIGKDGREILVFKFRTMYIDAQQRLELLLGTNNRKYLVFKMRRDPRITRFGGFLRRYSLDELPQMLNVLRGEMSLVGPRAALPLEIALYTPRQRQRLTSLPGVTGLWQVSGRANLSFEHSIEMDLYYIKHQSIGLYLRILLMTIPAVLGAGSEGSYVSIRRSREDVRSRASSDDYVPVTWQTLVHPERRFTS
jgi:lipopolysaccharide/colanic/teichoic acid biosynthesis glycosyltransferase